MGKYYSYRAIDGTHCPIRLILSRRGLGKTFGAVKKAVAAFVFKKRRFVYVVETEEQLKELSQNNGEKFFSRLLQALESPEASRKDKKLYETLQGSESAPEVTEETVLNKIHGGTIKICGETAGYIVAFNSFAKIKRNNFRDMAYIIIDEFIPETVDVRSLQNARKIVSIVQSIARNDADIVIYLCGNSIRLNDAILMRLGLTNLYPGEMRIIKDKYGAFIAAHYVNNADYPEFEEEAARSVAGRLAKALGETELDENKFVNDMPASLRIPSPPQSSSFVLCLHGLGESVRIHMTRDRREWYVFNDFGRNNGRRFCVDQKFASPTVKFFKGWKDSFVHLYQAGSVKFEGASEWVIFKAILGLDTETKVKV